MKYPSVELYRTLHPSEPQWYEACSPVSALESPDSYFITWSSREHSGRRLLLKTFPEAIVIKTPLNEDKTGNPNRKLFGPSRRTQATARKWISVYSDPPMPLPKPAAAATLFSSPLESLIGTSVKSRGSIPGLGVGFRFRRHIQPWQYLGAATTMSQSTAAPRGGSEGVLTTNIRRDFSCLYNIRHLAHTDLILRDQTPTRQQT